MGKVYIHKTNRKVVESPHMIDLSWHDDLMYDDYGIDNIFTKRQIRKMFSDYRNKDKWWWRARKWCIDKARAWKNR